MKQKTEKGYIFLPKPLTTEQYYLIKEYTKLKYINSYTVGFSDEMTHFENCETFYESIYPEEISTEMKNNPELEYEDAIDLLISKHSEIIAIELSRFYSGVSLYLPDSIDDITKEQWQHFLKYYAEEILEEYIDVHMERFPKELDQHFDRWDTQQNKKRLQNISKIKLK